MKKIFEFRGNIPCYLEKLENGLEIYLIPNKKRSSASANIFINFGGMDAGYYLGRDKISLPTGVAHFLEHQMFQQEDGANVFEYFDRNGAIYNASTSVERTRYYIKSSMKFSDNLQMLLNYVNAPYYEKKSVLNERKVIAEEHHMSMGDPFSRNFERLNNNLFHNHPLKTPVLGSLKDIKRTTPDDLYNAYRGFYTPNNTVVILAGNFDLDESLAMIKEKYINQKSQNIKRIEYSEPLSVVKKHAIFKGENKVPKFLLAYKIKAENTGLELLKTKLCLKIYNIMLFGKTSDWQEMVKKTNLVRGFNNAMWLESDQILWVFEGESEDYLKTIKKFTNLVKEKELSNELFDRSRKVLIASHYTMVDNNDRLISETFSSLKNYNEIYDSTEILRSLNYNEFEKIIDSINLDNHSYVVEKQKNKV